MDENQRFLPKGVTGELVFSGPPIAQGYLNQPEQTAEVFLNNPFENTPEYSRMYRTGDIGRILNDGNLEYIGRNDEMVKIRGFRIELTEINSVISEFEGIKDSAVVAFPKESGGQYIAAYVVSDEEVDFNQLRQFIGSQKPEYMIPEAFVQIDEIPLTPNMKVNKRKLPEPELLEETVQETELIKEEKTYLEEQIIEILEDLIGTTPQNLTADLKHFGLTSLSVVRLAVELNKRFNIKVDVKALMNKATILSIENLIIQSFINGNVREETIQTEKVNEAPLSSAQFGVYTESMKNPLDTSYNQPFLFELPLTIDREKLIDSVNEVLKAHPYLFTEFELSDSGVVQVRKPFSHVDINVKRIKEEDLDEYLENFNSPFKILNNRLFRIDLVETEDRLLLLTNFHHILSDGSTLAIILSEISQAYQGEKLNEEDFDYFDYINTEKNFFNSDEYNKAEEFFKSMLSESKGSSNLPSDINQPELEGESKYQSLPINIEKIEAFCKENGLTMAQFFLGVSLYVISRYTGNRGAYINTISNGRSNLDFSNTAGMFVHTLPVGMEVDDITVLEYLDKAKEILSGVITNDFYPYTEIAEKYSYEPNILYAYQLGLVNALKLGDEDIRLNLIGDRKAKFNAGIYVENIDGEDQITVLYKPSLYSDELIEQFLKSLVLVSDKFVESPQTPVRKVSLLNNSEIEEIIELGKGPKFENPNKLLHKLLEEQAVLNPEKTALIAQDNTLSYSELNKQANIIANNLIEKGVKKGDRIALLLGRNSTFFTSLYGILKSGAAFIPINKEYPQDRINQILEDSQAKFIITDEPENYPNSIDIKELVQGENILQPDIDINEDDLAYLIYTSGSTGKPKGVMLKHKGIANYVTNHPGNVHVKEIVDNGNVYGSVTSVSFDMSMKETILSLSNGLTLVFADEEGINNPALLTKLFEENEVDVFNATPSRLQVYMELPEFKDYLKNLKVLLAGGEKYPEGLLDELKDVTEATVVCSHSFL